MARASPQLQSPLPCSLPLADAQMSAPPSSTGAIAAPAPGFASFDAGAFFAAQQATQNADAERRRHDLTRAAEAILGTSSSSSSESDHDSGSPRRRRARRRSKGRSSSDDSASHTSSSDSDSNDRRHKKRKRRRSRDGRSGDKRKRRRKEKRSKGKGKKGSKKGGEDEREKILRLERKRAAEGGGPTASPLEWLSLKSHQGLSNDTPLLYYDRKGDLQNVVYKALYAGNTASYHRRDPLRVAAAHLTRRWEPAGTGADGDGDAVPRGGAAGGGRYWYASRVVAERSARLRRVHIVRERAAAVAPTVARPRSKRFLRALGASLPLPDYISLDDRKPTTLQVRFNS